MARLVLSLSALVLLIPSAPAQPDKPKPKPKFTNRLAKEQSPYLLMHAHNPTDWYAWGPEAFEKAKKENKIVLVSIGYSSCFWCHVMERESFNNEAVAKILNDNFVCIKVDREERPDIDQIYMTAHNVFSKGRGGWPLNMFLLPDGKPIFGGTYWPPEDQKEKEQVYAGFKSICGIVIRAWTKEPEKVKEQADEIANATITLLDRAVPGIALVKLDRDLLAHVVEGLKEEFDPNHGGFGSPERNFKGTKFPLPSRLEFLLTQAERTKDKDQLHMVTLTLEKMARGGIYDQLGGGFHRYSTERTWTVPHFEKMLYDNAQLAEVYSRAYRLTKNPLFKRIVTETLAYVEREMMSPEGAFYSSQDAETHHEEGRSYVWTPEELKAALPQPADLEFAKTVFGIGDRPNFEGKYHILKLPNNWDELAKELKMEEPVVLQKFEAVRRRLLEVRDKRDKPLRNEIALTAWSGQMIAGFARAGIELENAAYVKTAQKAADFVLQHQVTDKGRLLRTYGAAPGQKPKAAINAYLEDYAFLSHGLLTLHQAGKDKKYLEAARKLTDAMVEHHSDKKIGGYFFTANDHEKLFARGKDQFDGAQPSGNSLAARNLVRLWSVTDEEKYLKEAEKTFRAFAGSMKISPTNLTTLATGVDEMIAEKERREKK